MIKIEVSGFGPSTVLDPVEFQVHRPKSDQVRIRVHAAGVNPADTYIRSGQYEFLQPRLPFTPGFDAAGIVDAVGDDVTDFEVGDRVYTCTVSSAQPGAYTQSLLCDASAVRALPSHLSFAQGASLGIPYTTAYRALVQRGDAQPGEIVLVHGASGGVGMPAVQIASAMGLIVIGTAGTAAGRELISANGAHYTLNHSRPGYLDEIDEITKGRGVDLIVEMAAGKNLQQDITLLSPRGRVVVVGCRTPVDINPRILMRSEADIRGIALWNMNPAEWVDSAKSLDRLLRALAVVPVIGETFNLVDAVSAHDAVLTEGKRGKIVLTCE